MSTLIPSHISLLLLNDGNICQFREEQMKSKLLPFIFLFNTIVSLSVDYSIMKNIYQQLFFFSQSNLLHFHIKFISQFHIPIQL